MAYLLSSPTIHLILRMNAKKGITEIRIKSTSEW
jgi:hypothetical protein